MIEQIVYQRLSNFAGLTALIGPKLYPTTPTENTQLPFLVFTATAANPELHTGGTAGLTNYNLEIDAYGVNLDTVLAILAQVKAALHAYRGGNIQGSFLQTQQTQQEEYGYHGQAIYSVWVSQASVQATIGDSSIVLAQACDNILTLDYDGLKLNGKPIAGGLHPPRLTLIEDWTTHFERFSEPDQLGVFKYVDYRNKPHRTTTKLGWANPYTPHKGKRWELVFELPPTSTSWTFPTNYADSIRPHDNGPYIMNPTRNLRNSINPKSFRIGAKYGNLWLLSSETIRFLPNKLNPNTTKLGFGTPR
jgi:hypothetical protein